MKLVKNVALRPLMPMTDDDGWETSTAQAFNTIFYTSNYFAAYSDDKGQTFHRVNSFKLTRSVGHAFAGSGRRRTTRAAPEASTT
jgi:hypothetical protein